jgi:hypothetical protein
MLCHVLDLTLTEAAFSPVSEAKCIGVMAAVKPLMTSTVTPALELVATED